MTDLALTSEQRQYLELARDFTQNEIAPRSSACDHSRQLPLDLCRKAFDVGLMNVRIPERYGGLGLSLFDTCVIFEELGAGCTGIASAFEGNELFAAPVMVAGTDEQKKQFLEPLAQEFCLSGYCFAEPGFAADGATISAQAKRSGGSFVLSGKQLLALNASQARWLFVLALDGQGESLAFVVPCDSAGVVIGERIAHFGRSAADLRQISFDNVEVAAEGLLGSAGQGLKIAREARLATAPILGSEAVGIGRAAFENARRYAWERTTFAQPIGSYQAISFMLADMEREIETARLLCWKAAWLVDNGMPSLTQSLMAKTYASDMAMKAATDAVQIYGGYGYSREYPVEKLMRDAKMFQIFEGTSQSLRVELGRQLLRAECRHI